MGNMMVKRVLVDTGSSVNIMYKSTLERMKLSVKDLEPCNQTIYGFSGEGLAPAGMIKIPVTMGSAPASRTLLSTFVVVDCPSAYNAIIGRPILVDLRAVISMWHLAMKFPTDAGGRMRVGEPEGSQGVLQRLNHKGKEWNIEENYLR